MEPVDYHKRTGTFMSWVFRGVGAVLIGFAGFVFWTQPQRIFDVLMALVLGYAFFQVSKL